jgi:4-hydroxybenzoate polyprenyltransferase
MLCYAAYLGIWAAVLIDRIPLSIVLATAAAAAAHAAWHFTLIRGREREGCFKAFRVNHWLGFTVFAGIVAGYALK